MNELKAAQLRAADHLGNAINTFMTCTDRKVQRSTIIDAVDAVAQYAHVLCDQKLGTAIAEEVIKP